MLKTKIYWKLYF